MTDKKEFDQEELRVAFERLNQSEGLQPSAELDAMILQMAADEVQLAPGVEEKTNVTDISDISFRRGQREAHTSLKKKGMFPKWVMPMGLAATVLLSFGVVNRVLLSPEFDDLTKQSSYEAMSDELVVTSSEESKFSAKKDTLSFNKPESPDPAQMRRSRVENSKAKVTVNGNEMNADISFADAQQPVSELPPPAYKKPESTKIGNYIRTERFDGSVVIAEVESSTIDNSEEFTNSEIESKELLEEKLKLENQPIQPILDSRQEQHALLAKEKREHLTQARRSAPVEPEMQMAPTAGFSVPAEPAPIASNAGASVGSIASADAELAGASRAADFDLESKDLEIQAEVMPSITEMDSLEEEVVVTGSRLNKDNDDLADKAFETRQQVLESVLFEHKQCQVKEDCALVALACDSCDCLEPVNSENYNNYQSEFSQSDIAEQCINTAVECVRNYCQVQQSE